MKLKSILNPELIFINETFSNYDEILVFLSEKFSKVVELDRQFIYNALVNREKLSSTYIGKNTALPHEKFDDFDNIIIAFIKLRSPISIKVEDATQTLNYVFSVLATRKDPHLYLNVLQTISTLILKNLDAFKHIETRDDFFHTLDSLDLYVGQFLTARFFSHDHPIINETAYLSEAINLMKEQQVSFLPVVDNRQKLIGTLSIADILVRCFPEYVMSFDDFSFLQDFEPLISIWKQEFALKVKDHMFVPQHLIIRENTSHIEILFLIAKYRNEHIVVVNDADQVTGVINCTDVLNKLLRP
ncbi:PTS sugar transporter subunit IIA [bacterium]|nr:PTS sugar transporter subunit IIA [bacterium]MBU1063431.1 PTS sugar transporter subunit IIA [bacterium]MBU1634517.1 PTS sugar transporter subunit IIA [bacterium]MBU1874881.1 PTS sugar transporter subunit IIA [bacterium]